MGANSTEKSDASAQQGEEGGSKAVRNTAIATGGAGCLLFPVGVAGGTILIIILCGFGILLAPLIAIYLLFHAVSGGSGGDVPGPSDASSVIAVFQGDGQGDLDTSTVPEDLVAPIQKAGKICEAIGPVVIASQIEKESGFDAALAGPDGKQGISQLPPDVFAKYGKDDDDNGKTSALDAEDSIMAQGRYP
ncbi:lytic transglycosylase domain-containing protein, partial [Streptomyces sp. C1-2]|uniref:lytic transglycosylase domain-containing protein n=1 Tax=Streptomyces sp. C1-2 TaxID=2720022 RepID=UPI00143266E8